MNAIVKVRSGSVYVLLALSIVFVIVSAVITYNNTQEKKQSMDRVIRRYQSIGSSTQLLSLLKDMETGQRGYVITGDSDFLEPYNEARGMVAMQTDSLKKLLDGDEQQTYLLEDKIIAALQNKRRDLENTLAAVNTFGKDSAARRIHEKTGKAYMDTLTVLIRALVHREQTLLDRENKTLETNTRMEDNVRFLAFLLIGLTSAVALVTLALKQRNINTLVLNLKRANETLEHKVQVRTTQLVNANTAKDHFLGIASHDLKVPIAGVLGLISLMRLENTERSENDLQYLDYMEDACKTMQELVRNLLDINRIEQGQSQPRKTKVELASLLNKLNTEFSHAAEKKSLQWEVMPAEGTIHTDPDILQRILENLISNAFKFSSIGKTVKLNTVLRDDTVSFAVIDEGLGIPVDEMPNLFKKFQRLTNRPTAGEGSTGLGLSIVKELVSLLEGQISVTSVVGEGSTFVVTLPTVAPKKN
ncbi:sensor histidine kinase [Chryseolinea lacunae]|uniref:histidine kinase n=1 Tax=Chryseolinea lacunae TaxID=2801331 RepID=A0ABS1KTD1_9BACT|nr:CHASE3 domain-containing protein [Chryseolinea lacunae]MBL0742720.1 CHASE3 domain-containing protein [Chryseolinea lacunae]